MNFKKSAGIDLTSIEFNSIEPIDSDPSVGFFMIQI